MQELTLDDLKIIKQSLEEYWFSFDDSSIQQKIGNVENKIKKLMEAAK